jgi:hypothetical protein
MVELHKCREELQRCEEERLKAKQNLQDAIESHPEKWNDFSNTLEPEVSSITTRFLHEEGMFESPTLSLPQEPEGEATVRILRDYLSAQQRLTETLKHDTTILKKYMKDLSAADQASILAAIPRQVLCDIVVHA